MVGDEEIKIAGSGCKVFAISGTMSQIADACKVVTEKLAEAAQALEYKIVFLVPESYCGMFVGKKGSTINEIRGDMDLRVRVDLSRDPIVLPGNSRVTLCTISGPQENMKDAIERTVAVLGAISTRLRKQMSENRQRGDRDGGYRGTTTKTNFHSRDGRSRRKGQGAHSGGRW